MVPGFGVWAECQSIGTIGKKQRAVARSRGHVIQPKKLSVGEYFELSFLGCGFLFHLSNRSDSPRFPDPTHQTQAPWLGPLRLKKAKSNFFTNRNILHTLKNEPLNIMLLHTSRRMDGSRGLVIQPQKLSVGEHFELSFLGCGFLIHLSNRSDCPRFRAPWKKIRQKYGTQQEPSLFKGSKSSAVGKMNKETTAQK